MTAPRVSLPKPEPRARAKRRTMRLEGLQAARVRALCVERDGYCRLCPMLMNMRMVFALLPCKGPSEWAHLVRRFTTRGMAPEKRHNTAGSFMACQFHHDRIDRRRKPWITVAPASSRGANGPLAFQVGSTIYVEPER